MSEPQTISPALTSPPAVPPAPADTGNDAGAAPSSWNDLALTVAWKTWSDIHVKAPAIIALGLWAYGAMHPDVQSAFNDLATKALCYFGGAAFVSLGKKS